MHLTPNQALNLLYINEEQPELLSLTKVELRQVQLQVIGDWNFIDSPYKKYLVTKDIKEFIAKTYRDEPLFKLPVDRK